MASRIDKLVHELTLDEKASLTAGLDAWHTTPVERLGIPSWRLTDGPSGARGVAFEDGAGSTAVPCGTALGATWNPELVERVGAVVGQQARAKGCRVLLAPTVNLHRSPLGGRTFESYSEDPLLSGRIAAGFVRGAQAEGVACTVKHFAGNEAEFERHTIDSVIDERTLRELYLLPFEIAVREGGALGIMTAYNRLNGTWCAEHSELLTTILREEWGFQGFAVSDWLAVTGTVGSTTAGLDLEMPGPGRQLGARVADAVRAGAVDESLLDAQARRLLAVFDELGALDDPPEPGSDTAVALPEHRAIARQAATESMVLLRNEGVLPFDLAAIRSLAVIGANADRAQITGGGSSALVPHHRTTPLDALRRRLGGVSITYEPGCVIDRVLPPLHIPMHHVFLVDGKEVLHQEGMSTRLLFFGPPAPALTGAWTVVATGILVPEVDGAHEISLVQAGRARVLVDGVVVLDGVTDPPPPGTGMFGFGSEQRVITVDLRAGQPTTLTIELSNDTAPLLAGVTVGVRPVPPGDLVDRAVAAAAAADATVLIVGTNDDWESESHDRTTLDLPGAQDELVRRVCAANPRTVVVLNAGSPVALPWGDHAPALLDMWFGGQEMADALVDVLTGEADPGGRLPTSFPQRIEHTASFGNFPGEHGQVCYGEGVLLGYRWHEARHLPARFAFGHGLSYTTFQLGEPEILDEVAAVVVRVMVMNTGVRPGSEVVQLYVEPVAPTVVRPPKELKAFAKVSLDPGRSVTVELRLDERAFAYWRPEGATYAEVVARATSTSPFPSDPVRSESAGWHVEPGAYRLHLGRSSIDIAHVVELQR